MKDTRVYLGKTHCNQTQTLERFPLREKLEIYGVTKPPLYIIQCNDKISTSHGNELHQLSELANETDNHFINPPTSNNKRSFYQKNKFSIWVVINSIFLIFFVIIGKVAELSIGITFLTIMAIGIKNMFFKEKKLFASSNKKRK